MNIPHFPCPHCGARTFIRNSERLSRTLREVTYQCKDVECGHTFVANVEAVRTLSPSAKPDPAVMLPISDIVRQRMQQQLELLP